jgi:prevent-host-death family protein
MLPLSEGERRSAAPLGRVCERLMAETVKVGEAKTHLSELLARVEAGEEFVIARGSEPVARLVPLDERAQRRAAIEALRAERSRWTRAPVTMDEMIAWKHEGHRY